MQVFRAAFHEHDARKAAAKAPDGTVDIAPRARQRREGVGEDLLRAHLEADLTALLNTIRLDAAVPLDAHPHVARSILNFGFRDLSNVAASELNSPRIVASLRQSMIDFEPRLVPDTLDLTVVDSGEDDRHQRLSIHVSAELLGDPVDVPLEFDAEVDLGAGKLRMSALRVRV